MAHLQHPNLPGVTVSVGDAAAGLMAVSGWVPAEGQPPPRCEACGQVLPGFAEQPQTEQTEAPAESGASASESTTPRRRRRTSEESE